MTATTDPEPPTTVRPPRPGRDSVGTASVRDLARYLGGHTRVIVLAVAISLVGAALSLAQPLMVNLVISAVGSGDRPILPAVALVALVVGSGLLGAVRQYLLERTAEGVVFDARVRLIDRLLRLPIREYDRRRTGDLVSRVGSDTTLLRSLLTGGLIDALGGVLVFAGSLVAMAVLDLTLLMITLAVIAVAVAMVVVSSSRIQTLTRAAQDAVGDLASGVERAVAGIRTIRAAGAAHREGQRLRMSARAAYQFGVRIARLGAVLWPVSGLAVQGAFLAVLGVGGYRVAAGTLTIAELVTFILFLSMMVMPLGTAFGAVISVRGALGALGRIQEILDLAAEDEQPDQPPGSLGGEGAAALVFDNVHFSYGDGVEVLSRISFEVPTGSTTAIVGPSGAGKSTVLALIERFYEVDEGTIRLHGHDLRAIPRDQLRRLVGYVEQEASVLAGSVRENLVLAAPQADEQRCRQQLAAVNLLERIDRHPDGLDAEVGDGGVGLSGGERQRLALARALLTDAPVLLLDEPSASLDGRNEQAMREAIRHASDDRTVLIVAHRLATVVDADQIVVLDRGQVLVTGTHRDLLAGCDLYRELAAHQLLT